MNKETSIEQPETKEQSFTPQWRPQDADREYIKMTTRKRVRNATVPPNAVFKPAKPTPTINDLGKKRVAVYARVSTKSTEQVSSIENQTKYYSEKIAKTPNWEMQGIYKDEGISGTSIKRRKDFQRINSGEEHSKVLSLALSGYEVPYGVFFMNQSTPTMTISYKTIRFNKAMFSKMENCKHIEILYHPILKMIAVRESTENNNYSVAWTNNDGTMKISINSSALSKSIFDHANWKKEYSFKFRGITRVRGNQKIVFFYLDEPQIILDKKSRKKIKDETAETGTQYIEYKTNGIVTSPQPRKKHLISEDCDLFGISLSQRQKRDWIVHSVSEQDILTNGICVDNPLIGALPSQSDIQDELNQLISSM